MDDTTRIDVGGGSEQPAPYQVVVGRDLLGGLVELLPGAAQIGVVYAPPMSALVERVGLALEQRGVRMLPLEVPDAEAGKTLDVAARCWDALGAANATRTDAVVGIGGGAVTDVAGFVASCWLRGVRWVPVATSLLGMVDAAIGGKTGVNTDAGKNLVGAFHPPVGVLCDLDLLDTLPPADLTAGLAEVVKCGFIADPAILTLVEGDPEGAADPASPVLRELVERAVRVKARVVSEDLTEAGLRETLNYGHTLGHAIERLEGYRWRHGPAVSVGLVYAAALGARSGRLDRRTADRHRSVLDRLGLPVTYPAGAWSELLATMRVDKKARGDRLRFVVLDGLGSPSILEGPSDELLAQTYQEVAS
jgi:3-dehydroquinate synthase